MCAKHVSNTNICSFKNCLWLLFPYLLQLHSRVVVATDCPTLEELKIFTVWTFTEFVDGWASLCWQNSLKKKFIWPHQIFIAASCVSFGCLAQTLAVVLGLTCCEACGMIVSWLGIKPVFPALQGRVLTTRPPGEASTTGFLITCNFPGSILLTHRWDRSEMALQTAFCL